MKAEIFVMHFFKVFEPIEIILKEENNLLSPIFLLLWMPLQGDKGPLSPLKKYELI